MAKLKQNKAMPFVILFLLSVVIMVMTFILGSGEGNLQSALLNSYFRDPLLLAMNLIPIVIVFLIIYSLSGRLYLGFFLTSGIFFAISVVQKFKMIYRDEPFFIFRQRGIFVFFPKHGGKFFVVVLGPFTQEHAPGK